MVVTGRGLGVGDPAGRGIDDPIQPSPSHEHKIEREEAFQTLLRMPLLDRLIRTAESFDGHLTIMKFTTNWRVGFGTPRYDCGDPDDISHMPMGKTFEEAARAALDNPVHCQDWEDVEMATEEEEVE